jgi:hypothetical protein
MELRVQCPGPGGLGNGGGVGVADGANTLPLMVCLAAIGAEVPRTLTERSTTVIATTIANRFVFIFFLCPSIFNTRPCACYRLAQASRSELLMAIIR